MPRSRSRASGRILCVNCRICVNTLRRLVVFELDKRVISLLSEWISPEIITDNDVICEACYNIASRIGNEPLAEVSTEGLKAPHGRQAGSSRQVGHTQVCLLCGCSLNMTNRQRHLICNPNPSSLDRMIRAFIETRVEPRQITTLDLICHSCWTNVRRSVERQQQIDEARIQDEVIDGDQIKLEPVESNIDQNTGNQDIIEEEATAPITLLNYRRAANTASHCIFSGCTNQSLHNITDSLRATILSSHHFYIPIHARICTEHLHSNAWESLYHSERSIRTFTVEQVEHIFSFVTACKPFLDFSTLENIRLIDDNSFLYWTGRSKEDFITIINDVPRLQEVHRGVLGLAALLIKSRTGDSDERLSTVLNVSRRTLERLMNSVKKILAQDSLVTFQ